jgi:precorrin-6A/cobalt-precorrin-6A reductase
MARVLLLAGTAEATDLASRLSSAGIEVISSLAGVTRSPVSRQGAVRIGGFGGVAGLVAYLRRSHIDVLIDATHPFASVMPFHAASAAAEVGVAHFRLLRPEWAPTEDDRWLAVPDIPAAVAAISDHGFQRVFLTVGRTSAAAFASCADVSFVVRAIEPLGDALPGATVLLQRGPFNVADELRLLREHRIDSVVAKNSGGPATSAKLIAARQLGLPVVMIARPPQPETTVVSTVEEAVAMLGDLGVTMTEPTL